MTPMNTAFACKCFNVNRIIYGATTNTEIHTDQEFAPN